MEEKEKFELENSEVSRENETQEDKHIGEKLIEGVFNTLMGQCLDMIRISEVTDRSCKQMERNIRQNFNKGRGYLVDTFKEKKLFNSDIEK